MKITGSLLLVLGLLAPIPSFACATLGSVERCGEVVDPDNAQQLISFFDSPLTESRVPAVDDKDMKRTLLNFATHFTSRAFPSTVVHVRVNRSNQECSGTAIFDWESTIGRQPRWSMKVDASHPVYKKALGKYCKDR